jgi:biopolymer transport protein TolR
MRINIGKEPEINVTPFVDVLLILLVIFIVTSVSIVSGFVVDLPKGSTKSENVDSKRVVVSIDRNGVFYLNDTSIIAENFIEEVEKISKQDKEYAIFIFGDRAIQYNNIMSAINKLNKSGYQKIVLVTDDKV